MGCPCGLPCTRVNAPLASVSTQPQPIHVDGVEGHEEPDAESQRRHVISSDLVSERLKNKKHYNSFRPDLGDLVPRDQEIQWEQC
jgi:hypothetical protein